MRYLVRQQLFSLAANFWITDEAGNEVFLVDGHALQFRKTFELKDPSGAVLAMIRQQLFQFRAAMDIERDGAVIATVRSVPFSLKNRYQVTLADGSVLEANGSFTDMNWELTRADGQVAARISRQWFKVRDTYGVEVGQGEDAPLVIAIAVCIDRLRELRRRRIAAASG